MGGREEEEKDNESAREGEREKDGCRVKNREIERERREGRAVDGLDIVSAESSSIKSNYDVIDRGPVG